MHDLTIAQRLEVERLARRCRFDETGFLVLEARTEEIGRLRRCRRCGMGGAVLYGRDSIQRQRFRCREAFEGGCGRTFNALTGTPLARLRHPEQWGRYAHSLLRGFRSVRALSRDLEIGLSATCVFRWRHRFLNALREVGLCLLDGIVEADETFFPRSFKGHRGWKRGEPPIDRGPRYRGGPLDLPGLSHLLAPVAAAVDRTGMEFNQVLDSRSDLVSSLRGRIAEGSVICTDGLADYRRVARKAGAEHRIFRQGILQDADPRQTASGLGLGRINAHHERLKSFINRQARGVSTRFLDHYIAWLRMIRRRPWEDARGMLAALAIPA